MEIKEGRYPNLRTVIIVEELLKKQDKPVSVARIRRELAKQIMHKTLYVILDYLHESGKIAYERGGLVRWNFSSK